MSRSPSVNRLATVILIVILVAAFGLRVWNLTGIPPGLTHDEANHGREAIGILEGVLRYFFPLNYGSEPLYSYTVALSMGLLGRGLFALRWVNVVFGVVTIAATYGWAARHFGRATALLAAALMAVSFWPVASSREALRAGMLPFFMALAVWFFWRMMETASGRWPAGQSAAAGHAAEAQTGEERPAFRALSPRYTAGVWWAATGFGISLAATLHIYLAARVSWLLFPLFLAYLALTRRADFRRVWRPALAGLLLGALLSAPLFLYLRAHPEMQTRLDMLDAPLQSIARGEWRPVLATAGDALLAFVWPGRGDTFLAYNIPGRPVFDVTSSVLFVLGLATCLWRWRRPAHAFLLLWFIVGILPSLITGPTANTTRNLAALPAVFLLPAVGFSTLAAAVGGQTGANGVGRRAIIWLLAALWLAFAGFVSARDYFVRWANSPIVRGAYQHTLVASLDHVATRYPDAEPVIFSSVYPGAAHDPSIAFVLTQDQPALSRTARWADARWALALPPGGALAVIPYATPPHPALSPWLEALETVDLLPDDYNPRFTVYRLASDRAAADVAAWAVPPVGFAGAAQLIAARWLAPAVQPGQTAELLTAWRVLDPARAGPANPPTFATDAVLFTHVLDGTGGLLTQRDSLDAPSWAWQPGDVLLQIHPLVVPTSAAPGAYATVIGFYDRASMTRLPVAGGGDTASVPPLIVKP